MRSPMDRKGLFLCAIPVFGVTVMFLSYCNPYYVDAVAKKKAELFDRFCSATLRAMREDGAIFASGTLPLREEALRRFYMSSAVHHGHQSVELCLNNHLPETPSACILAKDWKCLAEFARSIELRLRKNPLS